VGVDGGTNNPGQTQHDAEVALDIQVAGGVAPGARIVVYFAPYTGQGFVHAVTMAVHDTANQPSVISISWGDAEVGWAEEGLMAAMNSALLDAANLGLSVFVASGDGLAPCGIFDGYGHVSFPAASPWAIGCG
jgi:kumamolisin